MGRRALVLVVAFTLAGCGAQHAPRVVPWIDERLPDYRAPTAQLVHYPATAPPCNASHLNLRFGRTGAATGHYFQELDVVNVGERPCLVGRDVKLTAIDAHGNEISVQPSPTGTFFGQLLPADIAPHAHVLIDLETTDICPTPTKHYGNVALVLANGTVHSNVSIAVDCGLQMTRVGLPERYAQPRAAPGSPGTLRARLILPRTAPHGRLYRFVVVLRNPTARPVSLEPCPGYTASLFAQQAHVRGTYRLNCKPVSTIAPHALQRYAMQLRVPARASGWTKVGWSLDTATGPFAGGIVAVR